MKRIAVWTAGLWISGVVNGVVWAQPPSKGITLAPLGSYQTGIFDESAAEIVAHDPVTQQAFVTNAAENTVDVLDVSNPFGPTLSFQIHLLAYGDGPNSVAIRNGVVAVAMEADPKQDPGSVVFFDTAGNFINQVTVGALPDMLTFTPNGQSILVANEGEPNDEYDNDPEGSISIIDMRGGPASLAQSDVATLNFNAFTTTPVRGTHWDTHPEFGNATSARSYTNPRSLLITFGARF